MAKIQTSINLEGVTNYLLVVIRKTTDPSTEYARLSFAPPHSGSRQILFPDIDPGIYYVDYRTTDNPALSVGVLHGSWSQDATTGIIISERRYYTVGGPLAIDPVPNQSEMPDPYLVGKTIGGIFVEGFRYLKPSEWEFME